MKITRSPISLLCAFLLVGFLCICSTTALGQTTTLTLKAATDKKQYTFDEPIFVRARFSGAPDVRVQLLGDDGFHLILQSKEGKGNFCLPLSELRFIEPPSIVGKSYAKIVGKGLDRQLVIDTGKLKRLRLEAGTYDLRIGYSLDARKLEQLLAKSNLHIVVHPQKIVPLKNIFEGAVISNPVTVTFQK
jgi:hypothetical protein